jgi:hypothetical protein
VTIGAASLLAKSGEAVKSGPIGLAVILILCIACYFLFKSMSKHLKSVREDYPAATPAPSADVDMANEPAEVQRVADEPADQSAAGQPAAQPPVQPAERPSPEA